MVVRRFLKIWSTRPRMPWVTFRVSPPEDAARSILSSPMRASTISRGLAVMQGPEGASVDLTGPHMLTAMAAINEM